MIGRHGAPEYRGGRRRYAGTTMRRRRSRIPHAILLAATLLTLPAAARADEPASTDLRLPAGPPIQLDGKVLPAEWQGALWAPVGGKGARLWLRQCRGTLLVGFTTPVPWIPRSNLTLHVCPDSPKAGWRAPGFVRINFEPFEHERTHVIVTRNEAQGPVSHADRVVVRHTLGDHGGGLEMACGLDLFGVTSKESQAVRLFAHWFQGGAAASVTWPTDLVLSAPAGKMPPDLGSAERWARLSDWRDVPGSGAFPASDWKTWIEHDREIARRGAEAHAEVRGLVEESKKTTKVDKEQVPAILGNFEWIAQHEPLTANDQLALAAALRWLNHKQRALGLLDALVNGRDLGIAQRALYERALTNESMERYGEAARDWTAVAERAGAQFGAAYERMAEKARKLGVRWSDEQQARVEDDARGDLPLVALHTVRGVVVLQLYAHDVPEAVKHFLGLVESKFYDGTLFHRVIGDFMAQGGDPISRDQGCEFAGRGTSPLEVPMEINARHGFWRGAAGFARKMRESNGSQFFLMTSPRPDLGEYTCFGRVVSGLEHVDRIEHCDLLIRAEVLRK